MQELLGRLAALDPQASLGLRVIACFDELIVGRVNTRALLAAAAALAGGTAGFAQDSPARILRVTPRGELAAPDPPGAPSAAVTGGGGPAGRYPALSAEGLTVWLERAGPPQANDAIILERLALAVRIRHGRGRHNGDHRRELGIIVDPTAALDERRTAAARISLCTTARYRVVAAPLFAVWDEHPDGCEDVVATAFGSIHVLVVPHDHPAIAATPSGVGPAVTFEHLPRAFRSAVVALRLCDPPSVPSVRADDYGGLIGLLADLPADSDLADVDALGLVMRHSWGAATLDALARASSVRQAARLAGVHHSTVRQRLDTVAAALGFDPLEDGIGRTRLALAYLVWRLRHSRVLDLPPPAAGRD